MIRTRTAGLWYFIGAALVLFAVVSCDPAMAEDCATTKLEDRKALLTEWSDETGANHAMKVIDGDKPGIQRLIFIFERGGDYQAGVGTFIRGCQVPLRPMRLDPEDAARKHFGMPLAALFADEI